MYCCDNSNCIHDQHVNTLYCCNTVSLSLYTVHVMCNSRVYVLIYLMLDVMLMSYHAVCVYTIINEH